MAVLSLVRRIVRIASSQLIKDTWIELEECDVLFLASDNDSQLVVGEKHYSPLTDTVSDLFRSWGLRTQSIVTPLTRMRPKNLHSGAVSMNRAYLRARLLDLLPLPLTRVGPIAEERSSESRIWDGPLSRSKPGLIIGIQPDAAVCRAAKRLTVPIYDLQHGVISDGNPYYGVMSRRNSDVRSLPDGYLCWDHPSAAVLERWAGDKGLDVRLTGNPWFARFLSPDEDTVATFGHAASTGEGKPSILVSLQWGNSHCFSGRPLERFMDPALEKVVLETVDRYDWMVRLHPVQMTGPEARPLRRYIERTFGEPFYRRCLEVSALPLPLVLSDADLHLTQNSTVAIEASWLGVRTGFVGGDVPDGYFQKELEGGYASVVDADPSELSQWIESRLEDGLMEPASSIRDSEGFKELLQDLGILDRDAEGSYGPGPGAARDKRDDALYSPADLS